MTILCDISYEQSGTRLYIWVVNLYFTRFQKSCLIERKRLKSFLAKLEGSTFFNFSEFKFLDGIASRFKLHFCIKS